MTRRGFRPTAWLVFILTICAVTLILLPSAVQAEPQGLPPRPTPEPIAPPPPPLSPPAFPSSGVGYIELTVSTSLARSWTVVQWRDGLGDWHDVGGWQRGMDENDRVKWGVNDWGFGRGPFRWAVYDSKGGKLIGASQSFNLPAADGQTVKVVAVPQPAE